MSQLVQWLEAHMLQCPSKQLFLLDCPGCGLQRSVLALVQGEWGLSWQLYPPTIFILCTLLILLLHITIGLQYGAIILRILFISTTIAIAINYIYKIANHQLL